MLFLIEYDRTLGQVVEIMEFAGSEKLEAEKARLDLELELNRLGIQREVVVLESANEEALRRTHRRYFEGIDELVKAS